eukprot:TRINITY_DN8499_c0_g5_i1.p1 TRINITY_DN8499_c0_g5~~TRINITY_DN8499_c0_g5_i1.p1  ORF type:complete len:506 (-),score=83.73 TRINITY_DN8499_c0_g5_i1:221-1738(-)
MRGPRCEFSQSRGLCTLYIIVVGAVAEPLQRRYIDVDIGNSTGSFCGSGSRAGYYYSVATGENASKWVVYFEGGGECRTADDCRGWFEGGRGDSSRWQDTKNPERQNTMDSDCSANPDFCSWSKIYIPYCTADMHSGTRREGMPSLGGYFFSGHNNVVALLQDMKRLPGYAAPTSALITGASAGGIGSFMHVDFFAEAWPDAAVKAAPECGFFYAGVRDTEDYHESKATPSKNLGFIEEWAPFYPRACAVATNNNMGRCTDAHFLYPYIRSPLFIRENQYDTAKLANCGFKSSSTDFDYLKAWGRWMRAQLEVISRSKKDGFFSASCYMHAGNFGFESSPIVKGVNMRDALSNWFFEKGDVHKQHLMDDCGDLPCTKQSAGQHCPHYKKPKPPPTPTSKCQGGLEQTCPNLWMKGPSCEHCIRSHVKALVSAGCPADPASGWHVIQWYCGPNTGGDAPHHVCDLSEGRFKLRFPHAGNKTSADGISKDEVTRKADSDASSVVIWT